MTNQFEQIYRLKQNPGGSTSVELIMSQGDNQRVVLTLELTPEKAVEMAFNISELIYLGFTPPKRQVELAEKLLKK